MKKKLKLYEIYSLIVGFGAAMTILFFLIYDGFEHCIILFEPNPFIRITEIIMAISIIPYYLKRFYKIKNE